MQTYNRVFKLVDFIGKLCFPGRPAALPPRLAGPGTASACGTVSCRGGRCDGARIVAGGVPALSGPEWSRSVRAGSFRLVTSRYHRVKLQQLV